MSIRWIDDSCNIHEDDLGFIQLPDANTRIFSARTEDLVTSSLPLSQSCGQASLNMSSTKNGSPGIG